MTAVGPGLAPEHRTTWEISRPLSTHWRRVTCQVAAQVGMCGHYAHGFALEFNPNDPELPDHRAALRAANYRWTEVPGQNQPGFVRFEFPAEQDCLASRDQPHLIPKERMPILQVFRGDWRANGPIERTHTSHEAFAEDLWTHVNALQTKFLEG